MATNEESESENVQPSEGGMNLRYIVAVVRGNLKLILAIIAVILTGDVIYTLLQTPLYQATVTLQMLNNTSISGNRVLKEGQDINDTVGEDLADSEKFAKTQVGILQSKSQAARVAQSIKLPNNPVFFVASGKKAPDPSVTDAKRLTNVITLLRKNLTITAARDSRIISISYESANPQMSTDIANAYASEYIASNLQSKFDSSRYARDFLTNQLAETKQKLEQSEIALNAYSRSVGLIRDKGGDKIASQSGNSVTESSLAQMNTAANAATDKRISLEQRWDAVNRAGLLNSPEILGNTTINQLITQRSTAEASLAEERSRHLDDYPTVRAKKQSLDMINKQIAIMANDLRNSLHTEYMAAVATEKQLRGQVDAYKRLTLDEQDADVKFGLLAREVDTNRQLYDGLLQRYKELNASAGIAVSNVSVIDKAELPTRPSAPNIPKNLIIGLLAGVALAAIVVAIKDQFDDSIRIPEDIENKLSLPLLGVIPSSPSNDILGLLADPKSAISEAYNSLRGSLLYATADGLPSTVLITSAQPAEGKSTTSYALARGLARIGKTVLLIDCDMRRPTHHRWIDHDNEEGLSTLLTTQADQSAVRRASDMPNMWVLTSGPVPPSPTELLSGQRMREVLAQCVAAYDVVLVDAPPILGLADAPMLAALVEGVVFVVEADRSRHGALKSALRRLRAVRPNILGAALTKFDPLRTAGRYSTYYNYEYYQYQYSYQHQEESEKKP